MNQSKCTLREGSSDEEMSLGDLWQMLCYGWYLILGSVVAALVVAGIYLAITPSQYEASLVIKVGQVGVAEGVQQIESADEVVQRMQDPGFIDAVVESLGWKGDTRERLFESSYQVTSPGTTSKRLNVRLYGFSPDDARRGAEASLVMLADIHRGLAKTIVARRDGEFANIVADIADAEAFLRRIEQLGKEVSPDGYERTVSRLQAAKDEKSRLRALRLEESELKEAMKTELTTPTMAAGPVAVSMRPAYPKARRVWLFAAIGGLLLGSLLVSLRSIARMNKARSAADTQGKPD